MTARPATRTARQREANRIDADLCEAEHIIFGDCSACYGSGEIVWSTGVIDRFDGSLIERTRICEACNGTGREEIETEPAEDIDDLDERCGEGEFA